MNTTLFNVPNTIGIIRIILLYTSIFLNKYIFVLLYSISAALDGLDGKMARKYNQCTFLGSCLDMITDRSATILIFMKIIEHKKTENHFLMFTILTDIISHFLYFAYSINQHGHHKDPSNHLLRVYYRKSVLLVLCLTTELFFIFSYISTFEKRLDLFVNILKLSSVMKTFFHLVQMYVAVSGLSSHESGESNTKRK